MDDSLTYIKMCDKAFVKSEKDFVDGALFVLPRTANPKTREDYSKPFVLGPDEHSNAGTFAIYVSGIAHRSAIRLYRQDELQEIYSKTLPKKELEFPGINAVILQDFQKWVCGPVNPDLVWVVGCQASMEQLWLALVVKEKYGKVWNGEDWVK